MRLLLSAVILLGALSLGDVARAEADGPDFYRVAGVASGDVLNMRQSQAQARRA